MAIYVFRDGKMVPKTYETPSWNAGPFPAPMISRMEPYASPIDGREITSWGARDRDMKDNNAVDPRDLKVKRHVRPEPQQQDLFGDPGD